MTVVGQLRRDTSGVVTYIQSILLQLRIVVQHFLELSQREPDGAISQR